jgi:hypothetical protein
MNNEKQDHGDFVIVFMVIFLFLFNALWAYKYEWFVAIWYYLKLPVYTAMSYIPKDIISGLFFWVFWEESFANNIKSIAGIFKSYTFEQFTNVDLMNKELAKYNVNIKQFVSFVNKTTTTIYIPFLIPLFIYIKNKITSKRRFNRIHSIESLGVQESVIWNQIRPVIYEYDNFINVKSMDDEWFAMSMKPAEYFNKHKLVNEFTYEDKDDYEKYGQKYYKLDSNKMYNHFAKQIGEPWRGVNKLNFDEKSLLSIFITKLMREADRSQEINNNLAIYHSSYPKKKNINIKKLFSTKIFKVIKKHRSDNATRKRIIKESAIVKKIIKKDIDKIINQYFPTDIYKRKGLLMKKVLVKKAELNPAIQKILDSHFYKKTVFARFLEEARKAGVLASCEFLWIKKFDRDLWFTLSQVGRTASFVECAGVWSHYISEKKVGRKLVSPMIINTIHAADKYMFHTHEHYEPINKFE